MFTRTSHSRQPFAAIQKAAVPSVLATFIAIAASTALAQSDDLTPSGAEKAGTSSGIPAWSPPGQVGEGWSYGKVRKNSFKFKDDKPLYTIDASNVDKYADKLNPGQIALIKQTKGYTMPVYPTRRTCGIPDFVAENTKKNVGFAKLNAAGNALVEAHLPGYPFPTPKTGAEAIWNAKMHYRGVGIFMPDNPTVASPRKGGSEWLKTVANTWFYFPWAEKGGELFSKVNQVEAYNWFSYKSPAALAGQGMVFTALAEAPAEVYYYFPGQRRTRRMPAYQYDAPQIGWENQYTIDQSYVFAGLLDRFDWKLAGKKEMIIPYNSLGMYDFASKFEDAFQPDFVSPSHRRYELHRVWVVEATVKQGMRHTAPKRIFYLDEDSWAFAGAVDYDAQGKISYVREGHIFPVYETGSCDSLGFVQYNLNEGRYLVDGSMMAAGKDAKWIVEGAGTAQLKPGFYTADNLRALSER